MMHLIIFHNFHFCKEKNVNQKVFTVSITEIDRRWNSAESWGFI